MTNFTKTELDQFRHEEEDEDEDEEEGEERKPRRHGFVDFENGLKLRVKTSRPEFKTNVGVNELAMTETGVRNLNKLVMAVVTDCCVMIEGELSTGKTSLVETLSRKTNNKLIKYQMDEYMDSKV